MAVSTFEAGPLRRRWLYSGRVSSSDPIESSACHGSIEYGGNVVSSSPQILTMRKPWRKASPASSTSSRGLRVSLSR
jgi:hypothetical protein